MSSLNSLPQDNRLVVGIAGHIGAGKTSIGKYLSNTYGFGYIRYSQVLSKWLAQDPESKAHLQAVGWKVMAGGMQEELNTRLIGQIPARANCAVDGLRHPVDYATLKKTFPSDFWLLYVESTETMRWQRLREKKYPELEDFRRADSHPVEQQIDSLKRYAFEVIVNNGSLQELYSKVDGVLRRIRPGGLK
jgi:dephospho-CoA kinase